MILVLNKRYEVFSPLGIKILINMGQTQIIISSKNNCLPKCILPEETINLNNNKILCSLKGGILYDAVSDTCNHLYCYNCLEEYISQNGNYSYCPISKKRLKKSHIKVNKEANEYLNNMNCTCNHPNCNFRGTILEYKIHKLNQECDFDLFNCQNIGCEFTDNHKNLEIHKNICGFKLLNCEFCGILIKNKEMPIHCNEQCKETPTICENDCGMLIKKSGYFNHVNYDCSKALIKCGNDGCIYYDKKAEVEENHSKKCKFRNIICFTVQPNIMLKQMNSKNYFSL